MRNCSVRAIGNEPCSRNRLQGRQLESLEGGMGVLAIYEGDESACKILAIHAHLPDVQEEYGPEDPGDLDVVCRTQRVPAEFLERELCDSRGGGGYEQSAAPDMQLAVPDDRIIVVALSE